jgi:cobalt-zinc-cadmium resistance protein CzcA
MKNIDELILKGTTDRLRPVLLTAAAAALGFAHGIFSSAGAEVQRPLATVVRWIVYRNYFNDGCITTLFYKYFDGKEFKSQI